MPSRRAMQARKGMMPATALTTSSSLLKSQPHLWRSKRSVLEIIIAWRAERLTTVATACFAGWPQPAPSSFATRVLHCPNKLRNKNSTEFYNILERCELILVYLDSRSESPRIGVHIFSNKCWVCSRPITRLSLRCEAFTHSQIEACNWVIFSTCLLMLATKCLWFLVSKLNTVMLCAGTHRWSDYERGNSMSFV